MHKSYLIKPASSSCNMACAYCFYKDEVKRRNVPNYGIMSDEVMKKVIEETLSMSDEITYAFQGGEPTLATLNWFNRFVGFVNTMKRNQVIHYSIQTNGYQLNQEWVDFFKKYNFLVGVSLDGFKENHDALRGHFKEIFHFIRLLKEANVDYNILTVLSSPISHYPKELYQFYKNHQIQYVQLIACLPELNEKSNPWALKPKEFYDFYSAFFACWLEDVLKGEYMSVTLFDQLLTLFQGKAPSLCGMLGKCQVQYVIESNGNVYPCDFYCLDDYLMGNINDLLLKTMVCPQFLNEEKQLSKHCGTCKFRKLCHGNCNRMNVTLFDEEACYYAKFLEDTYQTFYQLANFKGQR